MTVKEVSIAMTPVEEKAITRLQTRRKRLRKNMTGGDEPVQESSSDLAPAPTQASMTSPPVSEAIQSVTVASPLVSVPKQLISEPNVNSETQTGGSKVQIISHKKNQTRSVQQSSGVAKILPTKRHVTVKRKPTVVVGKRGGMQPQPQPQTVTAVPVQTQPVTAVPVQPQTVTTVPVQTQTITAVPVQPQAQPQNAGALKKKKRFTERRLSISMKHLKATRKHKKSIRKKVKSMDIQAIRTLLLEKGILTAKSNPPEKMLRSMMKDYLLLQESAKGN